MSGVKLSRKTRMRRAFLRAWYSSSSQRRAWADRFAVAHEGEFVMPYYWSHQP